MKFKADKGRLFEAVVNASKACAVKTVFNALDGVLLSLSGNVLTVTGYDLEIGIRTKIKVEGQEDGDIVVDARLFGDMVKRMPGDIPVDVSVIDGKDVNIQSGKVKLKIGGISAKDFPNIIELNDSVSLKLKEVILKSMLSQVHHAIAQNDTNPGLRGARFEIKEGNLYIVGTDSVRMALKKENLSFENIAFTVPEKTVAELIRNLSDSDEDEVRIIIDKNQICFIKENYIIFSRLLDGKFIDYNRIVDFEVKREFIINCRDLIHSLERSLLLITEKYKSPVVLSLSDSNEKVEVKVSCKTSLGSFEEFLEIRQNIIVEENTNEFSIAFNPRFMIDALKNSGCDEVKLCIKSEFSPIKIVSLTEGDFAFIVVPVRIK
ncbi:MAG: DNA polymerase III subunit beta [Oscillospiraceae bacterium]|nr:DNA polymerase III subunit beta [Oscillospiraceae bacterium]